MLTGCGVIQSVCDDLPQLVMPNGSPIFYKLLTVTNACLSVLMKGVSVLAANEHAGSRFSHRPSLCDMRNVVLGHNLLLSFVQLAQGLREVAPAQEMLAVAWLQV